MPDRLVAAQIPGREADAPGRLEALRLLGSVGRGEAADVAAGPEPVEHGGLSGIVESEDHQGALLALEVAECLPEGVRERSECLVDRLQDHILRMQYVSNAAIQ
mmetsp:Transcript_6741/g.16859  ORF Transcript_6741/g.16859 Transcript_6741/m.16859 type:complete len:104 (-) Transcript_6741:143-454(-)